MKAKYTNEKNIQMLIYLLKENNIKKVVISPGTLNMSFVASLQSDEFFELYSCVDERSACYMACGLSTESREPVVITCTGATASRNYLPGLTEAFYRKLPIIAITATTHLARIGQNIPQIIDRNVSLNDSVKLSVQVPSINCEEDEWYCNLMINKAILETCHRNSGPVHINLGTTVTKIFNVEELPKFRKITRYMYYDKFPIIDDNKKIGIFVGQHDIWDRKLTEAVDEFCEKFNAVVICDHTSNYYGKYKILANLICDQQYYKSSLLDFDLLLHIGNVSGAYMNFHTKEVWRINEDGEIRDTFKKLTNVFEVREIDFFNYYNQLILNSCNVSQYNLLKKEYDELEKLCLEKEIPFSNLWVAKNLVKKIPKNSTVFLAILNSLRSWNYYDTAQKLNVYSNTGGFGIDGIMSTLIGTSWCKNNEKRYFGIIGDLSFFYDMNSIGNRNINNNLRIILINNGTGTEFHNYSHPASVLGNDMISDYIAADGHFGNKSDLLVKNYSENLGFEYLSASNKDEFMKNINQFLDENKNDKPIIFEIFTNFDDESKALDEIRNLKKNVYGEIRNKAGKIFSTETKQKIKKIIGRD